MKLRNFFSFLLPLYMFAVCEVGADEVVIGPLQVAGIVVDDLEFAIDQWGQGTGAEFGPITTTTYEVQFSEEDNQKITVRRAFSVRSNPFVELVEVDNRIGPWAPQSNPQFSSAYFGYVVDNINQAGQQLIDAGMIMTARSGNKFAFFEGVNGVIVKLIKEDLLPSHGGDNVSQADMDFGRVVHTDVSISLIDELKAQLSSALSIAWNDFFFPPTTYIYPSGPVDGVTHVAASTLDPEIELENIVPGLEVFGTTPTTYNLHVAYRVPAGTMETAKAQMLAAGFTLNTSVVLPDMGLVLAFYTSPLGYWIEVVDERVDF